MSWRTSLALVLILAGLGGYYWYDTRYLEPAKEKREAAKGRVWEIEAKDVEAVTLKRKADTVRLKRVGDGWEMLEPVRARGDRSAIDGLLANLVTLKADREVDAQPAKPADFGLAPPEAEVLLEVKGRPGPVGLQVGTRSPTGAWVFARETGKAAVVTVSEAAARDAMRPAVEFRDKAVLAFDRRGVTGLEITLEGDPAVLEAKDGRWALVKPRALPADGDLVGDFLDKLDGAKAKEFVEDAPKSLAPYGLDKPARVAIVVGKDKDRAVKALLLGKVDKDKKGVYAMREGEPTVMLLPEEVWTAVPKTVAMLRDKVVLRYAHDKVQKVEATSPKGAFTLERDGAGWKLTAPEALRADGGAVNGFLWSIRDLRASGFLAEEPEAAPRFLPQPDVTIRLWEQGAKEPRVLQLGTGRAAKIGEQTAVAAVVGQGPVVMVPSRALEDLAKTSDDLRDKVLFPGLEVADVKRARLAGGGKTLLVERKSENDWRVIEPKGGGTQGGGTKEGKVTDLLLTLRALRWKTLVAPKGEDPGRYGLATPELQITLNRVDGGELGVLLVGKQEGDVTYVRVKSGPAIYAVESRQLGDLRRAPSDIPS